MRRAALSVFLVAALTCLVSGQQPPVKTVTTGAIVDVTVVDAKGNAVLDLAPEDFEVSEDGVRQRVVSATLVQRGVVRPLAATAASDQTASPLTGAPAAASAPATADTIEMGFPRHATLAVADIDSDGDMDIVPGYFALNRPAQSWVQVWLNQSKPAAREVGPKR